MNLFETYVSWLILGELLMTAVARSVGSSKYSICMCIVQAKLVVGLG